jgi:hypothetical protein
MVISRLDLGCAQWLRIENWRNLHDHIGQNSLNDIMNR